MKCNEQNCLGNIETQIWIEFPVGISRTRSATPCNKCGRLHWSSGTLVFKSAGERAFYLKGKIVLLDYKGNVIEE